MAAMEINNSAVQVFMDQYARVFDPNGDIMACGRDETIRLIRSAKDADAGDRLDDEYGDERTGIMKASKIISLYKVIMGTCC